MISSAVLVQMKGFGFSLLCTMCSSIASISTPTLAKLPRRMRAVVMSRNHRSTRCSRDELVGAKWRWKRLCLASQFSTFSCLWVVGQVEPDHVDELVLDQLVDLGLVDHRLSSPRATAIFVLAIPSADISRPFASLTARQGRERLSAIPWSAMRSVLDTGSAGAGARGRKGSGHGSSCPNRAPISESLPYGLSCRARPRRRSRDARASTRSTNCWPRG